jgi:hypothetical protein
MAAANDDGAGDRRHKLYRMLVVRSGSETIR